MEVQLKEKLSPSFGFDGPDFAVITLLSLLAYVNLLATGHEMIRRYWNPNDSIAKQSRAVAALRCFSIPANVRQLLSPVQGRGSSRNFGCINGIRVIFTCQIVVFHVWANANFLRSENVAVNGKAWWFQFFSSFSVSVDSFLVSSGFLAAFQILRELDCNKGELSVIQFYIHRYLRLTPLYGILLGISATLLPHIKHESTEGNGCRLNWWKHFLYVNNMFPDSLMSCMGQTYYLAIEMQLFLVVPLFVYLLWRWPVAGRTVLLVCAVASVAGQVLVSALLDVPLPLFTRWKELESHRKLIMDHGFGMWQRAPPFLFGVLAGWMLYRNTKRDNTHMSKAAIQCCWMITFINTVGLMFGIIPYQDETETPVVPQAARLAYLLLYHTSGSLMLSWTIYACSAGHGGALNRFLSWKWFDILGRLTFCVYLIHPDIIGLCFKYWNSPIDRESSAHFWILSSTVLIASFGLAFLLCSTVEFPLQSLERIVLPQKKSIDKRLPQHSAK